jgi:hypothetical protein
MNTLFRILNTLLLAGILAMLILIFLHIREPISVQEPVEVEGWTRYRTGLAAVPIPVKIDNEPLQVEISR